MRHGIECGCGHHGHHPHRHGCHHGAEGHHHEGGFGPRFGHRRFLSREEIIARLEEYLKQLQAEAKGVEERIAELKKGEA